MTKRTFEVERTTTTKYRVTFDDDDITVGDEPGDLEDAAIEAADEFPSWATVVEYQAEVDSEAVEVSR